MKFSLGLVFCVAVAITGCYGSDEFLRSMLADAVKDYSDWLLLNGLNPTPFIPHSVNLSRTNENYTIVGEITNQRIHDHSKISLINISTNVSERRFNVWLELYDFTIYGDYFITGTLGSDTPVNISGQSIFKNRKNIKSEMFLTIERFGETADGYIDFSVAFITKFLIRFMEGEFKGLSAAGEYEDALRTGISLRYHEQFDDWSPLTEYFRDYIKEYFRLIPYDLIVGDKK